MLKKDKKKKRARKHQFAQPKINRRQLKQLVSSCSIDEIIAFSENGELTEMEKPVDEQQNS